MRPRLGLLTRVRFVTVLAVCCVVAPAISAAQASPAGNDSARKITKSTLFDDQSVLKFTLSADFRALKHDTRNDNARYRPARISYTADGQEVVVPVKIKPRGIWRRKNCDLPPIRLNFAKDSAKHTVFAKQSRLKLVDTCKNGDDYEQYVLQEFQLYRVQNLLTPLSFRVRLAHVTYIDSQKKDTVQSRFAFLTEEPEDATTRMGGTAVQTKGARGDDLEPAASAMFGVFQYFIGNTDFSVSGLHNVLLLRKDSVFGGAFPVAWDFDWTGAVNAKYAFPDYRLPIKNVTQRLMKGDCVPPATFNATFDIFRAKKDAIYALYSDSLAAGLKPDVVRWTLKFYDEFYEVINDKRRANREIIEACGPS
jgi:hypothetical protein